MELLNKLTNFFENLKMQRQNTQRAQGTIANTIIITNLLPPSVKTQWLLIFWLVEQISISRWSGKKEQMLTSGRELQQMKTALLC